MRYTAVCSAILSMFYLELKLIILPKADFSVVAALLSPSTYLSPIFSDSPSFALLLTVSLFQSLPPLHLNAFGSAVLPRNSVKSVFFSARLSLTSVSPCNCSI